MRILPLVLILPLFAGGCLGTVGTIMTAPVRVTSKVVDWTTTSQAEADRNRGRKLRKQEEREGRERRKAEAACRRHPEDCDRYEGDRPAD